MSIDFLQKHGFLEDPFESTNAANEPSISSYFVAPPILSSGCRQPIRT